MKTEIEKWENEIGIRFLKKIGIKKGQTVLDFGCKTGGYTIPIARTIGNKGIVYAIDKRKKVLRELGKKANDAGLKNIIIINTAGKIKINLEDESINAVLLYDILHYFKEKRRKKLYQEIYRILKQKGLLSVYPKHNKLNHPLNNLKDITPKDIIIEVENEGFDYKKKYCEKISHDSSLEKGCVLNFRKNTK